MNIHERHSRHEAGRDKFRLTMAAMALVIPAPDPEPAMEVLKKISDRGISLGSSGGHLSDLGFNRTMLYTNFVRLV